MKFNGVGIVGNYENIIVRADTVAHSDNRHLPIEWINPYTFYFKWCDGNEQIWTYDTTRFCIYQIANSVNLDMFNRPNKRLSRVEDIVENDRQLGNYVGITIYESSVNHCGKTLPITWINPYAFYFYYDPTNLQVWIYDPELDAYLQLGVGAGSVNRAHARELGLTHSSI